MLSGVIGLAGGTALLAVMLLFLEPLVAIPLHAVVQLFSNGSRTWIQRRHVRWDFCALFSALLLPAGYLGLAAAQALPVSLARLWIGAFVLAVTWIPARVWLRLGRASEGTPPRKRLLVLGGAVGFLGPSVGATGPLLAPFFLHLGLPRQVVIGTQAACQIATHGSKILLFGWAGFAFAAHAQLLLVLCVAVIAGTWVGSHLLDRMSERGFLWLYRAVLTALSLRLIVQGV